MAEQNSLLDSISVYFQDFAEFTQLDLPFHFNSAFYRPGFTVRFGPVNTGISRFCCDGEANSLFTSRSEASLRQLARHVVSSEMRLRAQHEVLPLARSSVKELFAVVSEANGSK